jgi:hypothetical protein
MFTFLIWSLTVGEALAPDLGVGLLFSILHNQLKVLSHTDVWIMAAGETDIKTGLSIDSIHAQ